jgi:hypothetical protein
VITVPKENSVPSATDLGLSRKELHGARLIRDADLAGPPGLKLYAGERSARERQKFGFLKRLNFSEGPEVWN